METLKTNNQGLKTSPESDRYLPKLPDAFWSLADSVKQAWEDMHTILFEERGVLMSGDFRPLLDIAEKKKRKADEVEMAERTVASMVDMILEKCGTGQVEGRWEALLGLVNKADVDRLDSWLTRMKLVRARALFMNRRNEEWVRGQLKMVHELLGVMIGDTSGKMATYGPTARVNGCSGDARYKLGVI